MALPEGVKGAPDYLPPREARFAAVEAAFLEEARLAGYQRLRTPVFEHTDVFARGVGASTDIVQKEMYTFPDRGGRSLTLRPEATAGILRAVLEAGLPRTAGLPLKVSFVGEMFRYEQPQAGRQRVFTQVDIEAFGSDDPALDAEVVLLGWDALQRAGCPDVTLILNNLGDRTDRPAYLERLGAYLDTVDDLPEEVRQRRHTNPLRAFDSSAPGMAEVMAAAPLLPDHVSAAAQEHYAVVCDLLRAEGVPFVEDPRLVRGLDYYTRTTFEYQVPSLGPTQNAVGGGGRYDGLAEDLGWPERFPGIGWALGVDRTLLAIERSAHDRDLATDLPTEARVDAFVIPLVPEAAAPAFALTTALRRGGIAADLGFDGRRAGAQLKAANRAGARVALLLGPDELAGDTTTLKDLGTGEQRRLARSESVPAVATLLGHAGA